MTGDPSRSSAGASRGGRPVVAGHRVAAPGPATESLHCHRERVVRRLLARGLSPHVLIALLPDFRPVVQRVLRQS